MNKASLAGALTVVMLLGLASAGQADDVGAANGAPIGHGDADLALRDALAPMCEDETRIAAEQPVDPEAAAPADVRPPARLDGVRVAAEPAVAPDATGEAANDALASTREDDMRIAAEHPVDPEAAAPTDEGPAIRPDDRVATQSPVGPDTRDDEALTALPPVMRADDTQVAVERLSGHEDADEAPVDVGPAIRPGDRIATQSLVGPDTRDDEALTALPPVMRADDTQVAVERLPGHEEADEAAVDVGSAIRPDDRIATQSLVGPDTRDDEALTALPPAMRADDTQAAVERLPGHEEAPVDVGPAIRPGDRIATESLVGPDTRDDEALTALPPVMRADDTQVAVERLSGHEDADEAPVDVGPAARVDDVRVAVESLVGPDTRDDEALTALPPVMRADDTQVAVERLPGHEEADEAPVDVGSAIRPDDRIATESPVGPDTRDDEALTALPPVMRPDDTQVAVERLPGHEEAEGALRDLLPFSRQIAVTGRIAGTVHASTVAAGAPGEAMLEALQAFATTIDLDREVRDGDRFHVRYEQTFAGSGTPIGVGRVLWAELVTAIRGTISIHRFTTQSHVERFWLANGQAATPPSLRLPLEVVSISSGFGLRADPFNRPPPLPTAGLSGAMGGPLRVPPALPPGLKARTAFGELPLSSSAGQSSYGSWGGGSWQHAPRVARPMFMHEGVDFVAPSGTPVLAAAEGVVIGAGPNGRYGNWIRIDHANKLSTIYAHLSGFARGLEAGSIVSRGEIIGFVGSTGRSTGAHLHFELLDDGKPANPINHPETRRGMLRGPDLDRLRKQVTQSLAEREREATVEASRSK